MPPFLEKPQNMVGNPGIQVPHGGDTQIGLGETAASIISANTCTVDGISTLPRLLLSTATVLHLHLIGFLYFFPWVFELPFPSHVTSGPKNSQWHPSGPMHSHGLFLVQHPGAFLPQKDMC